MLHAFGAGRNLTAYAGGPYSGNAEESIQFEGTVFGGVLPYTYLLEFGDGNTSNVKAPAHTYAKPGVYQATFTVIDGDQNSSSDTTNVTVGTSRPTVTIIRPDNAFYCANIRLFPLQIPLVIGRINVKVDAYQEDVGINRVCFYVDTWLQYTDYEEPYEWVWNERLLFSHTLAVSAVSNDGKRAHATLEV
jgi:PKD repeat protein